MGLQIHPYKMGHRLSSTQAITFDNVRVPRANAIGAGGRAIAGGKRRTTYDHDTAIAAIAVGRARGLRRGAAVGQGTGSAGRAAVQSPLVLSKKAC